MNFVNMAFQFFFISKLIITNSTYFIGFQFNPPIFRSKIKRPLNIWTQRQYKDTVLLDKDYYIDGRNTQFCQLPLGEDFKL